jgi:hypothetical protein
MDSRDQSLLTLPINIKGRLLSVVLMSTSDGLTCITSASHDAINECHRRLNSTAPSDGVDFRLSAGFDVTPPRQVASRVTDSDEVSGCYASSQTVCESP